MLRGGGAGALPATSRAARSAGAAVMFALFERSKFANMPRPGDERSARAEPEGRPPSPPRNMKPALTLHSEVRLFEQRRHFRRTVCGKRQKLIPKQSLDLQKHNKLVWENKINTIYCVFS